MSQHLHLPTALPTSWTALPHDVSGGLPRRPQRREPGGSFTRQLGMFAMTLGIGVLAAVANPVQAAGRELAPELHRLATCEDSWYDSRSDEARMTAFGTALRAQFQPQDRSPVWKPIGTVTWLGSEVLEIMPQSVGMGLGFAVTLKAPVSKARSAYERALGQPMQRCEASDGLDSCERSLAPKRTAIIMAPQKHPEAGTLLGCYYFYQP